MSTSRKPAPERAKSKGTADSAKGKRTAKSAKSAGGAPAVRYWTRAEGKQLLLAAWNREPVIVCPACGGAVTENGSNSHILRIRCAKCGLEAEDNFG